MLVGYARTSSLAQVAGLEAQERELRAAGCDKIFAEQVSSVAQREQLGQALDYVRDGDTLTVTKLDRLARSVGNLLEIVARLEAKKVSLRVLAMSGTQPLDTGTANGRLMLAVIGAVGQAEREAMLERQRDGIAKAKAQGRYRGRVPTVRRKADEIIRLKAEGFRPSEIAWARRSVIMWRPEGRNTSRYPNARWGAFVRRETNFLIDVYRNSSRPDIRHAATHLGRTYHQHPCPAGLNAASADRSLRHSFASPNLGYNEPTIASLLGHKTHSLTSRYMHSANAVLLAAADAVAKATMKLMAVKTDLAPDQAQPQLWDRQKDGAVVWDGITSL